MAALGSILAVTSGSITVVMLCGCAAYAIGAVLAARTLAAR